MVDSVAKCLPHRQMLETVHPISEPPPVHRFRHSSPSPSKVLPIRRTNTVLVMDTPRHTSANTLMRHHSSPPYSPHLQRLNKRKRKATEIEDSHNDQSDPFKAGSSVVRTTASQTRDAKLKLLKSLTTKPCNTHIAEYMRFKGRGRYSNANA